MMHLFAPLLRPYANRAVQAESYRRGREKVAAVNLRVDAERQRDAAWDSNKQLRTLLAQHQQASAARIATLQDQLARMEEELLAAHGEAAGLRAKLAGWELADTIADETRTKRYMDGLGDV